MKPAPQAVSAPPATHAVPESRRLTGAALAVIAGVMVAIQSRINGELGARMHDGVAAAVASFATGLILLIVLTVAVPSGRRGLVRLRVALRDRSLRGWQCLGGVCGAFLVTTQGLTVAVLGVAVFTVAVVAGQTGSSLIVDRMGAGPGGPRPFTTPRVVGAVLAVLAVVIAVYDRLGAPRALALAALPLLAGIGTAWQQAVNGRVRDASSAVTAALVNFVVGAVALLLVFAVDAGVRGVPSLPHEWWLYVGGAIGVVFIAITASVVRYTGVLLLGLATVAGQLIGALVLDLVAPTGSAHVSGITVAGIALTLVAVAIAAVPSRR